MTFPNENKETLDQFRKSFSYGSRNDLLFKFLGTDNINDQDAGEFFRGLLEVLGDAFDTNDHSKVLDYCFRWQVRAYEPRPDSKPAFEYGDSPWAPLKKPLSESRLSLISTAGVFVEGDDPLGPSGPTQEEAAKQIDDFLRKPPILSTIPKTTLPDRIRVRHPGYDIRGALKDYNVTFPLDHLKALEAEGVIGELADDLYAFVGAASQLRLLKDTGPKWVELLKSKEVDATLLVAA